MSLDPNDPENREVAHRERMKVLTDQLAAEEDSMAKLLEEEVSLRRKLERSRSRIITLRSDLAEQSKAWLDVLPPEYKKGEVFKSGDELAAP